MKWQNIIKMNSSAQLWALLGMVWVWPLTLTENQQIKGQWELWKLPEENGKRGEKDLFLFVLKLKIHYKITSVFSFVFCTPGSMLRDHSWWWDLGEHLRYWARTPRLSHPYTRQAKERWRDKERESEEDRRYNNYSWGTISGLPWDFILYMTGRIRFCNKH